MLFRGLKSKIIFNLALVLLIVMLVTDVVAVRVALRKILKSEADLLAHHLDKSSQLAGMLFEAEDASQRVRDKVALERFLEAPATVFWNVSDLEHRVVHASGTTFPCREETTDFIRKAVSTGVRQISFCGKTWGVFWLQNRYLVLSQPVERNGQTVGGILLVRSLDPIYLSLRQAQRPLLWYSLFNLFFFTAIGFYRLRGLYLKPIQRLVRRAAEFQHLDDRTTWFSVRKSDNELHQLSSALNRMLRRMAEDKKQLGVTVAALEKSNIALRDAQKEIIQAEKLASVGRLSSGIAHEIGNPIGIISGYLELLKRDDLQPGDRRDFIERTAGEIERIHAIIRQLLDLSKPSGEGMEHMSMHRLLRDVSHTFRFQPLVAAIELKLRLDADRDTVRGNPGQLRQVLLNLVLNATDAIAAKSATEAPGRILIATRNPSHGSGVSAKTMIEVTVEDDGIGIPKDRLSAVFDPFFTTKDPGKGTGLGLWVSYTIVEAMGGTISVESEVDRGTRITLSLPLDVSMGANPTNGSRSAESDTEKTK